MQFVALIRPGLFLNLGGKTPQDYEKAYNYKRKVAEGFAQYLGPENKNTLLARRSFYQEFHWLERFDEALQGYLDILSLQRKTLDENTIDIFDTLQWVGIAHRALTNFPDSRKALLEAAAGYKRLSGASSKAYLLVQMFLGFTVEAEGNLDEASSLYSDVYDRWIPVGGNSSPFSTNLLTAYGSLLRKQANYDKAEEYLFEAFGSRLRVFTLSSQITVDSGLHLAVLYRQMRDPQRASELLNQIEGSSILKISYERAVEVAHIKALIAFDKGEYSSPRNILMQLVLDSSGDSRDRIDRELLWVRLNLADALRDHDENDLAPMLFSELVTTTSSSTTPSPSSGSSTTHSSFSLSNNPSSEQIILDTPHELEIAEQALRLVRDAKATEAADLLAAQGLRWVREKDFWIISGGPKVDTDSVRYELPPAPPPGTTGARERLRRPVAETEEDEEAAVEREVEK